MSHATERRGPGSDAAPAEPANGAAGMERILKRETRSSRAVAAVIAAVLVIVLSGYALLETAVRAIGQPPWLVDPEAAAEQIVALPAPGGLVTVPFPWQRPPASPAVTPTTTAPTGD